MTMSTTMTAGHAPHAAGQRHYRRFSPVEQVMHVFLMISFIGLALSGIPLLFADQGWAQVLVKLMGGFVGAALIHRISAAIMLFLFVFHILRVCVRAFRSDDPLGMFWGPNSMTPNLKDAQDMVGMFKWFFGLGPRPQFDRYTYWEKFDYLAVFWGMFIIGGSGLLLWFPTFFSKFLPGWMFNLATLVHGEEALLAVGFIFTIHFFNGHLRPEKFPMDMVIFTGSVSEHELKDERPLEYQRLVEQGRLGSLAMPAPTPQRLGAGRVVGTIAVLVGLVTAALIIYGAIVAVLN